MEHDVEYLDYPDAPRCYGAEDVDGSPLCDGPDVRHVRAQAPNGEGFDTAWCVECRRSAEEQGYLVVEVAGDVAVPQGGGK